MAAPISEKLTPQAADADSEQQEQPDCTQPDDMDILDSYIARDPAATSRLEVALTSSGLHAVLWHHMCHKVWKWGLRIAAHMLANVGRWLFGVEIHPQAQVGRRLFIDHGLGVVIGATSVIGDDVSIYQGVTLGGVSQVEKGKRHPTIGDGAVIGAGAKVLGPIEIGCCARVGSNAVVVRDVAECTTVVGVPAHEVTSKKKKAEEVSFVAYAATGEGDSEIEDLQKQIDELRALLEESRGSRKSDKS